MEKNISKLIYWIPRILSIIFVGFLFLMSLDVFQPGLSFWQIVLGLFMHNIPAIILLIVLLISWKHEIVGGVVFILAGIAYIAFTLATGRLKGGMWVSYPIIAGPAFLIGILFIVNWIKKRKINSE